MLAAKLFLVSPAIKENAEWVQLSRQVAHWSMAADRLAALHDLASAESWRELERYLGLVLYKSCSESVNKLQKEGALLRSIWSAARTEDELKELREQVMGFRARYLRTETLLDFYSDAINTRTNPNISALLRACDVLAHRSMAEILDPMGKATPPVLTYIDKGLGASILKAGLRLWDGSTTSQTAAIKIVRHNLYRPTSLIHEAGHQVAHILHWNEELTAALETALAPHSPQLAEIWASWASEIAADSFAFVHTGYAAVASLYDVLDGGKSFAFRYLPGDPHPVSYIRVLLGIEMCRQFFGSGPWDQLGEAWMQTYPLESAKPGIRHMLQQSQLVLPKVVDIALKTPMRAFNGKPLIAYLNPDRVHPKTLAMLELQGGSALYTSPHWVWKEPLRLLALTGYRAATALDRSIDILQQQKNWMSTLGTTLN
jgi:hypothetical protein